MISFFPFRSFGLVYSQKPLNYLCFQSFDFANLMKVIPETCRGH